MLTLPQWYRNGIKNTWIHSPLRQNMSNCTLTQMSRTMNHSIVDLTQDESCSNWFLQSEQVLNPIKNVVIIPLFWQICNPFSKRWMDWSRINAEYKPEQTLLELLLLNKQFKDNLTFFYCHFAAGCVEKTCPPEGFQGKDCECWCKGNPIRLCSSITKNINVDEQIPDVGEIHCTTT